MAGVLLCRIKALPASCRRAGPTSSLSGAGHRDVGVTLQWPLCGPDVTVRDPTRHGKPDARDSGSHGVCGVTWAAFLELLTLPVCGCSFIVIFFVAGNECSFPDWLPTALRFCHCPNFCRDLPVIRHTPAGTDPTTPCLFPIFADCRCKLHVRFIESLRDVVSSCVPIPSVTLCCAGRFCVLFIHVSGFT